MDPSIERGPPPAQSATETFGKNSGAAEQGGDHRELAVLVVGPISWKGDFDVVDIAGELPVTVDELAIEKLKGGVDDSCVHYAPALVANISGMAATAATTTMTR